MIKRRDVIAYTMAGIGTGGLLSEKNSYGSQLSYYKFTDMKCYVFDWTIATRANLHENYVRESFHTFIHISGESRIKKIIKKWINLNNGTKISHSIDTRIVIDLISDYEILTLIGDRFNLFNKDFTKYMPITPEFRKKFSFWDS